MKGIEKVVFGALADRGIQRIYQDEDDNFLIPDAAEKKTTEFSKTANYVDLRLTRPPESMKEKTQQSLSLSESDFARHKSPGKVKGREIKNNKTKVKSENLFEDLTPEAQIRLNTMLRSFLDDKCGLLQVVDLYKYGVDTGEVVTNATVQELCAIQPNLTNLNLSNCSEISDVALWAIAKHCPRIQHLVLSCCDKITNIGLRSLSLRCSELLYLDFTNCYILNDLGLASIACGCFKLKSLNLTNCYNITDSGVGKVVKSCQLLEILNLHCCHNVGEFGDHGLKEIATYCKHLKYLDLVKCKHVSDNGLSMITTNCTKLETLKLSNCDGVTVNGLRYLCKNLSNLKTLILSGCQLLHDSDFQVFHQSVFKDEITSLDISYNSTLSNAGVGIIVNAVGNKLMSLNLSNCKNITDKVIPQITNKCVKLREIDLSNCYNLTDSTLHTVAKNVTGLTSLKLDGVDRVTSKALSSYTGVRKLEFADMAQHWRGFQPKLNAADLIAKKEVSRFQDNQALMIQNMIRRHNAWKIYKEKRRIYIVGKALPRFQALFRGYAQRKIYKRYKYNTIRHRMAIRIQNRFRLYHIQLMKRYAIRMQKIKYIKLKSAILLQRMFHGMKARKRVVEIRNNNMNLEREKARLVAIQELKSLVIQGLFLTWYAKRRVVKLKELKRQEMIQLMIKNRNIVYMQKIVRGKFGKKIAIRRRKELQMKLLRIKCAITVQRVYRGHAKRLYVKHLRELMRQEMMLKACIDIQKIWRGCRAKMLVAVLKALKLLRKKQSYYAGEIQRVFRGGRSRTKLKSMYDELARILRINRAAINIQRLFRGHKGREVCEVELALKGMEGKAGPLFLLLRSLEEKSQNTTRMVSKLESFVNLTQNEADEIERELLHATKTTSKFTDSKRVNGIPQRFLTKFLIVRLQDCLDKEKVRYLLLYCMRNVAGTFCYFHLSAKICLDAKICLYLYINLSIFYEHNMRPLICYVPS